MDNDEEPKLWVKMLKLVLIATVLIGGVWLALWYASLRPVYSPALEEAQKTVIEKSQNTPSSPGKSWGIAKDSPLRR